jgi:hypothetical protein
MDMSKRNCAEFADDLMLALSKLCSKKVEKDQQEPWVENPENYLAKSHEETSKEREA